MLNWLRAELMFLATPGDVSSELFSADELSTLRAEWHVPRLVRLSS